MLCRAPRRARGWNRLYKWYICYMAVLNLRGIPTGLVQTLKADAALAGVTLRDHCVRLLGDPGPRAQRLEQETHNPLVVGSNPSRPTICAPDDPDHRIASSSCPDCGSVGSTHQRWCQR